MVKYILKRLLQSIITLFIIVSVVFLLMRLMPTDYFFTEDELIKLTDEQKNDKLEAAGLLDPPFVQLGHFYQNMFTLDYTYEQSRMDAVSASLNTGITNGLHNAVIDTVNEFYTDTAAAEKEISKINDKVVTDKVVMQFTDAAMAIEDNENPDAVAAFIVNEAMVKKLNTLTKDAKKAVSDVDAFTAKLTENVTNEVNAVMNGMDITIHATGFKNFLNHLNPGNYKFTFSLGNSYRIQHGISVITVIGEKFPVSMVLGLLSLALALVLGVVLGILQARFKGGVLDNVCTGYTIFVNAVPHLVSYTLIMYICARVFNLPMTYRSNTPVQSAIPVILCLSMGSTASYMLWMRRYMVDELNKDYIRLAQLKGLSTTDVMFKHVMKNAFLPLAQYLPYNILLTVGGSLLAESFFSVPGMGPLLTQAISRYDTNLVQAIVLLYAALGIIGVFMGDLLMGLLDPRISLTKKGGIR